MSPTGGERLLGTPEPRLDLGLAVLGVVADELFRGRVDRLHRGVPSVAPTGPVRARAWRRLGELQRLLAGLSFGVLALLLLPSLLLAGDGFQVLKARTGVPGVEAERGHRWPGFHALGVDPGRQELDHLLLAPLAGQPAPRDVGGLIRPVPGLLRGADREGRTSE